MKQIRMLCGLALAAVVIAANPVMAQTPVSKADGDLFLGFRASGGAGATQAYLVNVGQASQFVGVSSAFTVETGNLALDLEAVFGGTWNTRSDVFWSVSGSPSNVIQVGNDPAKSLYATQRQSTVGTENAVAVRWKRQTATTQGLPSAKMVAMAQAYATNSGTGQANLSTANNPKAVIQAVADTNSYASYQPGGPTDSAHTGTTGIAFAYFDAAQDIEASFDNGTAGSILELYRMNPAGGATGVPVNTAGELLGTFQLSNSGVLTFTPPTPSGTAILALSSATYSVSEAGAGKIAVLVNRSGESSTAVSAMLVTSNGTAVAGTDYTTVSAPVSFAAGELQKEIEIPVANRAGFQGNRTFTATLSSPSGNAQLGTPTIATATILENDASIAFSNSAYVVAENAAAGKVTTTIVRGGNLSGTVTVNFSTANDTAIGGTDFTAQTNTEVSFGANETEKTVDVLIANRAGEQGNRSFTTSLSGASAGASIIAPSSATVTINDQTFPGTVAFSAAAQTEQPVNAQGTASLITVPIARTNGSDGTVTVDVSVTGGTLASGTDYVAFTSPTTVSFGAGETAKAITIQLNALAATKTGTIILGLTNATGGASLGGITSTTINVLTRDVKKPTVKLTAPKAGNLGSGVTTFDVTGSVSDDRGIDRVEVTINGVVTNVEPGPLANGTATFTLTGVAAENGNNVVSVVAVDLNGNRSSAQKRTIVYQNIRPALAGIYTGLLVPTGAPTHETSGRVTLTVKNNGLFTGKVDLGAFTVPINGIVGNDSALRFKPLFGTSFQLMSPGRNGVQLGQISLTLGTNQVTGTLKSVDGATVLAALDGDRAVFNGTTVLVDADYLNVKGTKGFYTVVFPTQVQVPPVPLNLYPQGDGVGTIKISSKGIVTLKGTLADGTIVSASAPLSQGLTVPLYAKLYKKLGSIAGEAQFDKSAANSDVTSTGLLWFRPAVAGKYYPAGWSGLKAGLVGARFNVPAGASVLPGLGAAGQANGNATLAFSDGKLTTNPLNKDVDISTANKVTVLPTGSKEFSLKITVETGAISGNFTHSDTSKTAYKGAILQKGANSGGFGYFLSTVPKGSAVAGESGGVSLTAK